MRFYCLVALFLASLALTGGVCSTLVPSGHPGVRRSGRGGSEVPAISRASAALTVNFSYPPVATCGGPFTVSFRSNITGGTPPFSYQWNFGDGAPGSGLADPTHEFASASVEENVTLAVTDSTEQVATHSERLQAGASSCAPPVHGPPSSQSAGISPEVLYGGLGAFVALNVVLAVIMLRASDSGSAGATARRRP